MSNAIIGRAEKNWLVLPPEPPHEWWLDPAHTGLPVSDELCQLQTILNYQHAGGRPFTTDEHYAYHRERGKRDLFFLAKFVLGFDRLQARLHAPLAYAWQCPDGVELTRGPAGLFRWATMPRGHLKTTLLTIAWSVFLLLRDPDERILIYSANYTIAKKIFGLVRALLEGRGEQGEFFLDCFPELRTSKAQREKWAENALTIPRPTPYTDASLECSGIGALITGSHFTTENVDDVVGRLENKEQMTKILDTLDNLTPLLDSLETGKRRMACTPWGFWDPASYAEGTEPEALVARRCMFEEPDPEAFQGVRPVTNWQEFSEDKLIFKWRPSMARTVLQAQKLAKRSPYFMSCQYFCFPRAEGTIGFRAEWFRSFVRRGDTLVEIGSDGREGRKVPLAACNVFITVDPIGGDKRGAHGPLDPNRAPSMDTDYCGIAVVAVSEDNMWYVLDVRRERYNDDEFVDVIFDLVAYYKPRTVAIEGTAGQRHIFKGFLDAWRRGRPHFVLGEWSGGQASKPERIRGLIPKVSEGFLLFRTDAPAKIQEGIDGLLQELLERDRHDDAKDALSAMLQIAYAPGDGSLERYRETLNAWGEEDELLRLDPTSRHVWEVLAKQKGKGSLWNLGADFNYSQANAA